MTEGPKPLGPVIAISFLVGLLILLPLLVVACGIEAVFGPDGPGKP